MAHYKGFIGSYTKRKSTGIRSFRFNEEEVILEEYLSTENPTYLALSEDGRHLYSALKEGEQGGVLSLNLETKEKRSLVFQGEAPPCYLFIDGTSLLAANYHQGKLDHYTLKDGHVFERLQSFHHEGSGPVQGRQESSHIHHVTKNPYNGDLLVCDLGTDQIHVYQWANGMLTVKDPLLFPPGSGPRHLVFHGKEPLAYVFSELSSVVFTLETSPSGYRVRGAEPTLPEDWRKENTGAAIRISSDNRFLYVSNRGHDSISILKIRESGLPHLESHVSTEGRHPRDFSLTPDGSFLLAANMDTDNLVLFKVDKESGGLQLLRSDIYSPEPVAVLFEHR